MRIMIGDLFIGFCQLSVKAVIDREALLDVV